MQNKFFAKVKSFFTEQENRYSLYNSGERLNFNNKGASEMLKYNDISLYVNRAIDKRAEKVSEVKFVLRDSKGDIVEDHKLLDLLNRPNEVHTGKQFFKLFQKYLDLTGQAFIYVKSEKELFQDEDITGLYLLKPDLVKVIYNTDGTLKEYEYKSGKSTITYAKEKVLHCIEPDPNNPIEGVSLLRSGIRAIETEIQLEEYQANILKNGGKVEGIFSFKGGLTKTQIAEMKESYAEDLAGAKKSGRPLFLGGETTYQNVSLNPVELSYLQSKNITLNDICILTGVPKALLGSVDDQTFANADASLKIFLKETINPLLVNLVSFLDWRLIPEDYDLSFIDPTPEDVDTKVKIITALYATDSSTINERREIVGLDRYEDPLADEILVSFAKSPLGEDMFSPIPNPVAPVEDPKKDDDEDKEETKKKSAKEFVHPLKDKSFRDMYRAVEAKRFDRREKVLYSVMKEYFGGQEARLRQHLTNIKKFKTKALVDEVFDPQLEINIAKGMVIPVLKKMMIQAGTETAEMLDYAYGFTMTSSLESWLDNRVNIFAGEINKTTYKKLSATFTESFEAGETRQQLIKRITNVYEDFDATRAKTIARTETHGAVQMASFDAGKQAGSPIKIWVSVLDDVTRDSHAYLDGVEVPINQPFDNGLMFAGDPSGDADETINCRCSTV